MNERQEQLLRCIVENYASTAEPVGSRYLAERRELGVSSATIRNEMAELEDRRYIYQPHTSAGRIPTPKGYQYYIDHLLTATKLPKRDEERLNEMFKASGIRGLARAGAQVAQAAAMIIVGRSNYYYTGFSELFTQPEFAEQDYILAISRAVDELETMFDYFVRDGLSRDPRIYLGEHNPLNRSCSLMLIANNGKKDPTIFGFLSPLRTNYPKNIALLKHIANYL